MAALDPAQACPAAWLLRMSDFVVLLVAYIHIFIYLLVNTHMFIDICIYIYVYSVFFNFFVAVTFNSNFVENLIEFAD